MPTNAELLLAGYDAWNRDDLDGWLELCHPDIEISTAGVFPDLAPTYRGHEMARTFWRQMHEPWETFRVEVERIHEEDGGIVMGAIRFRGKGVDSGVEVDMRFGNGIRVEQGLATRLANRLTVEEVRKALSGLQPELPLRRSR